MITITQDLTKVYNDAKSIAVGSRYRDSQGNEFIFLKGVASTTANSWAVFDEAHVTALLAANAKGRVGIAQAAIVADKYGWYQIYGKCAGKVLASFADNGIPFCTATAGSVDDAAVAGDLVVGAMGRSAIDTPSTGLAWFELNYPFVTDNLGS